MSIKLSVVNIYPVCGGEVALPFATLVLAGGVDVEVMPDDGDLP